ncbi:MAG: PQQ-dependent sugar dehydrogenase [Actinobacteria bacterium]|nr:PQQ-dependent sugar dehydrogenase [Actinomycetota bacterium]
MRPLRILAVSALVAGLSTTALPAGAAVEAEPVATGLDWPAAFTFASNTRIFYGERFSGEIRNLNTATGNDRLFFDVPNLVVDGERGILGIALHPDYPVTPHVFVYATRDVGGSVKNQILRITNSGGAGTDMKVVFSTAVAGSIHVGGRILFGPDGKLYAIVGEAGSPANSQNLGNPAGAILRMNPNGKRAPGNPFAGSRIWAYGIRNSFGFAFDPETGRLWESENGPACNDELNRIVKGKNYGWGPSQTCSTPPSPPHNTNQDGPSPVLPRATYNPVIAPTGAAFCSGCALGFGNGGRLFMGDFLTGRIRRITLGPKRFGVEKQVVVYVHDTFVLSLEVAPGGRIHFSDDGAIYRLVKA